MVITVSGCLALNNLAAYTLGQHAIDRTIAPDAQEAAIMLNGRNAMYVGNRTVTQKHYALDVRNRRELQIVTADAVAAAGMQ